MDPSKFLDWIRLSPKHLLAILAASAFLTFGSDDWLGSLGLLQFRDDYQTWIGVPLLVSAALLAAHSVTAVWGVVTQRMTWRRNLKRYQRYLEDLSPRERAVLRRYIGQQTKTCCLEIDDGVVQGLVANQVLYRSSNVGRLTTFAFNIQPWAWDYLSERPHLLGEVPDVSGRDPNGRGPT